LFATADEAADTKKAGAVTPTPSDSDSSDTDDEVPEKEAVNTPAPIAGQKIELIDGHQKTWATTFVIDVEPKMPSDWHKDGNTGDYILVRGGVKIGPDSQGAQGAKPMTVASGWTSVKLFKKPKERKKLPDYQKFPGILQHDWSFFDRDITPSALMRIEEFLVDVQHIRNKPAKIAKAKKETKTSKGD
jgi:hypothetical protein